MFSVTKGIHIDFAHSVLGHNGPCINIHGHTWFFEVTLGSPTLSQIGFVADFKELKTKVLQPIHDVLDHSYATSQEFFKAIKSPLSDVGRALMLTRINVTTDFAQRSVYGATLESCGGIKVVTFDFNPTSERLAKWLFHVADLAFPSMVKEAAVYETLHPVQSVARYRQ